MVSSRCRPDLNNRHDTAQRQADPLHADDVGNIDSDTILSEGSEDFSADDLIATGGAISDYQDQPNGIHGCSRRLLRAASMEARPLNPPHFPIQPEIGTQKVSWSQSR